MDYKVLLWKYIEHVEQCEGTNFASRINDTMFSSVRFTDEEAEAVRELCEREIGGGD